MLTEHQLEIAARKLCEIDRQPFDVDRFERAKIIVKHHMMHYHETVRAIAYAMAQQEPT